MNRDDIIRMALEAGFLDRKESSHMFGQSRFDEEICVEEYAVGEMVERFAALVAAHEREQCARVCESFITPNIDWWNDACQLCADDIRARGEEPKRHPGYIIGDHWLQAAYTRICTGETEAEVMADYGWQRESR